MVTWDTSQLPSSSFYPTLRCHARFVYSVLRHDCCLVMFRCLLGSFQADLHQCVKTYSYPLLSSNGYYLDMLVTRLLEQPFAGFVALNLEFCWIIHILLHPADKIVQQTSMLRSLLLARLDLILHSCYH